MADDGSWDGAAPGKRRNNRASTPSSASTSGRRTPSSQRSGIDGKESRRDHRRPARGVGRKWGALNRWWNQSRQWAEQDPSLQALQVFLAGVIERLMPVFNRGRSKFDSIVEKFWPPVERWGTFVGRVLLIVLFAALECAVRGFKSVIRLSSAAICLSFWCSLLSLAVLGGFLSVTLATVVAMATSVFLGLIPGFAILSLYGTVVLWFYGSFWTTSAVILIAVALLFLEPVRAVGGAVVLIYSIYSCKVHGGWLGVTVCVGLSFVSSDLVIYFITSVEARRQSEKLHEKSKPAFKPPAQAAQTEDENVTAAPEVDQTAAEEEVTRVLGCSDHYAVLGFTRYEQCDEVVLKKEYRRKAMLVHPDKNKGNVRAEEAFKRLQNAYEVLLDASKKKSYDDDLRREQLIANFRRNGFTFHQNGRCESPDCACRNQPQDEGEAELIDARPIVCRNCKQLHMWTLTERDKQHARWCQECQEFHSAKDGDGWVEQFSQSFLFGFFQKADLPQAYACAGSLVYNVTEWAICQGMKCPANTHKPSFYVSTGAAFSQAGSSGGGGGSSRQSGKRKGNNNNNNTADGFSFPDIEETMSEQEFYEWLEKALASGLFDMNGPSSGYKQHQQQQASASNSNKHNRKKKKAGNKKQW